MRRGTRESPELQRRCLAGLLPLGHEASLRRGLIRVPYGRRRAWGSAFCVVLVGGLFILQWLTFRPPHGPDLDLFARVGAIWIVLLTLTAVGYARNR